MEGRGARAQSLPGEEDEAKLKRGTFWVRWGRKGDINLDKYSKKKKYIILGQLLIVIKGD